MLFVARSVELKSLCEYIQNCYLFSSESDIKSVILIGITHLAMRRLILSQVMAVSLQAF